MLPLSPLLPCPFPCPVSVFGIRLGGNARYIRV